MYNKSSDGVEIAKSKFSAFPNEFVSASYFDLKTSYPPIELCPLELKYK